ncbi:hypothetical protein BH23ACT10_BH23ACT10_34230 [soil metagenome]
MYEDQDKWLVYDPVSLGRAIGHFRTASELTQADLAESVGLHRPYLSRIERGIGTEQLTRVFRILRRLGLEVVVQRRAR